MTQAHAAVAEADRRPAGDANHERLRPLIRDFEPQDADDVIRISQGAFRKWPLPPADLDPRAYLEWFAGAPGSVRKHITVAVLDGRVVAVSSSVRHPTKALDEVTLSTVSGMGLATDPALQYRGLTQALRGVTDGKDRRRLILALSTGWSRRDVPNTIRLAPELSFFLKVLRPRRAAARRRGRATTNSLGYAWLQLQGRLRSRRGPKQVPWTVRMIEAFDGRVEAFAREAATAWDYIVLPTADYLNWRYLDPRAGVRHALAAEQDGKLLGYLVYSNRWGRGDIADVLALPGRTDVVRTLIDAAVANLDAEGASAVECRMLSNHPYVAALERTGFVPLRDRSKAVTQQLRLRVRGMDRDRFASLGGKDAAIHVVHGQFDEA